jgi:hypothetical protein
MQSRLYKFANKWLVRPWVCTAAEIAAPIHPGNDYKHAFILIPDRFMELSRSTAWISLNPCS